jgi:zinc transport system ATP-binding protein
MEPVVEIKGLSFAYEKDIILENINLTVEPLDFLAIIGPNGGGKSTLLKLMLGLLKPDSGTVRILGEPPSKSLSAIGYVPQNTNVNTDFPIKVLEVVLMGHVGSKRPLFGYGKEEIACAMGALGQVGMEAYAQSKIGDLSGGQRQRVMIARALCAHPKVLMLDEPTSSIDIKGQKEIYELLKRLNQTITVIVVSHDISVILEYANKAAHVNKRLAFHDISNKKETFHTHGNDEHFCEIELLQMLGAENCQTCETQHPLSASDNKPAENSAWQEEKA